MSRIVSVWLPNFSIERLKRVSPDKSVPDDRPFALAASDAHGLRLAAVNARSLSAGLYAGMGLADARAICPHLLTAPAAPDQDADALLALARWSSRYSPTLNADGSDGLWLDVTGMPHLFGGEAALLAGMADRFARAGFTARLALAGTLGGAHALARFARPLACIVPDGKIAVALAPLPVEALRLEPGTASLLRRLGLKRIGQFYDLPRASLSRRFHSREAAEAVLLRLDQALGNREEPRKPLLPAPCFVARLPFTEPLITHDGVLAGLDRLVRELCAMLARAGQGARRLALWLTRTDGSSVALQAGLGAPSHQPGHLMWLLEDKIETIDLGFGADLIVLAATVTEPLRPAQTSLTAPERIEPGLLLDRLVNRLGARAVRHLHPRASHIPELAQRTRSAFAGLPNWGEAPCKPLRPALLLAKPEPLSVLAEIPEGAPARFTWRRVTRRVVKAEGPERIAPEWWRLPPRRREPSRPRDYYRIEDEAGCRYWVFRQGLYQESEQGAPCWYLHGVFA